jgi:hypothetical protein
LDRSPGTAQMLTKMYSSTYKGGDQGITVNESSRPACSKDRRVALSKALVSLGLSLFSSFSGNAFSLFSLGLEVLGSFFSSGGSCGPV